MLRQNWPATFGFAVFGVLAVIAAAILPLAALLLVSLQGFWSPDINWEKLGFQNYVYVFTEKPVVIEALKNSILLGLGVAVAGMAA